MRKEVVIRRKEKAIRRAQIVIRSKKNGQNENAVRKKIPEQSEKLKDCVSA